MGPFLENNPWARQSFNQAMSCLQTGQQLEARGNLVSAGPYYQQALYALAACTQMLGPLVPDVVYYWMSCCQVRLGFLTHSAGNPTWALEWLRQALGSAQTACQRSPANPWYQLAVTQLALALGETHQAQRSCQNLSGHSGLAGVARVVQQVSRPGSPSSGSDNALAGKVKSWLSVGGKAIDILGALIKMVGGPRGDDSLPAMPGFADLGFGWLGSLNGASVGMGGMGGMDRGGFFGGM